MKITDIISEAHRANYHGLTLGYAKNDNALVIKAYAQDTANPLGFAKFTRDESGHLDPINLWVNDDYRSQGIAKTMYDYLKHVGFTINRSWDQTPAGAGFWDKHRGTDVRVWED